MAYPKVASPDLELIADGKIEKTIEIRERGIERPVKRCNWTSTRNATLKGHGTT